MRNCTPSRFRMSATTAAAFIFYVSSGQSDFGPRMIRRNARPRMWSLLRLRACAVNAPFDIAHAVVLEVDDNLVLLALAVVDGGDPAHAAAMVRGQPGAA